MSSWNPWPSAQQARSSSGGKKTARLIGTGPGKVHVLAKCHDWAGRAIYLYNLLTDEMIHITKPSDEEWEQYHTAGVRISHPGGIQAGNAPAWVKYGKQETERLGLKLEE